MNSTRLLVMCLWLSGCSQSVTDVVDKYRPTVEQKFSDITGLKTKVAETPRLTESTLSAPEVPLVLEKPKSDIENAMFVYADDLAAPGQAETVNLRTLDTTPLLQCGSLLKSESVYLGHARTSPSVAKQYLSACERLRYVLVIRGTDFAAPQPSEGDRRFVPGTWRADVLVFDLVLGKALGGFPVFTTNDGDVTVVQGEDENQKLLRNLEGNIYQALRDGARKAFPGSIPPRAF